jgi:hypothetical protein
VPVDSLIELRQKKNSNPIMNESLNEILSDKVDASRQFEILNKMFDMRTSIEHSTVPMAKLVETYVWLVFFFSFFFLKLILFFFNLFSLYVFVKAPSRTMRAAALRILRGFCTSKAHLKALDYKSLHILISMYEKRKRKRKRKNHNAKKIA